MNYIDVTGQRFGRLLVVSRNTELSDRLKHSVFDCKCDCGNVVSIQWSNLKYGQTQSCGCLKRESKTTHGKVNTRLYRTWSDMKQRCTNRNNSKFYCYGARGIYVCEEWMNDFKSFYKWAAGSGYRENLTIDRIDNDGNYEPSNCRWVTLQVQRENQRMNRGEETGRFEKCS